jgi:hypothetical protein
MLNGTGWSEGSDTYGRDFLASDALFLAKISITVMSVDSTI